ncbi:PASTA domain-containing protein [Microbacterium esteraromaticum]|uniref:PASTA domain-containing protein n=1 Tax=Microbacterium esteraromaticum TaxID=57043 RepID=A0A7D8AIQ2_9MICO|nr:PASTA domain-containing protein [Microbacterium esteraromaticum]
MLGGLLGLVGLSAVAGVLVTASVTPAIAVAGVTGSQALTIFDNLPNSLTPGAPMEPTVFYGQGTDGQPVELAKFFEQNRVPVKFEQVSPLLYDAILSSEDKSFYEHGGVNLGATMKAVFDNVRGTSSRGASTISQQFVKNVLIQECEWDVSPSDEKYREKLEACWSDATNAKGADGIERKLQEMRYAIQIEKDYSKNDILLGYLNVANFGGQTYGIEAASNYYFGTSAQNLTLEQAATLAGVVQNPNRYRIDQATGTNSLEDGFAATKVRRNYVLDRMLTDGKITEEQHKAATEAPIVPSIHPSTQGCAAAGKQAYFCQYAKSFIENDKAFGETRAERLALLKRGGLKVYTSLDMRIQEPGNEAMSVNAPVYLDGKNFGASGVTIEAATGRVLAIIQNTTFNETANADKAKGEIGQVYAADLEHGGTIGMGPGSAYKVFTLLKWLEDGHSVNETLDGRWRLFDKFTSCGKTYKNTSKTKNFGGNQGYVGTPMRFTAASLNTGYYAMAQKLDLCEINKLAERMGVHRGDMKPVTEENGPFSTVLGSKNIAPIQMASVYGTIANKGVYCTPRAIDRVVGADGKELKLPESTCTQVITPEVAATAAHALKGVMSATGSQARTNDGVPVIGKTGTNEDFGTAMATSSTKAATFIFAGWVDGPKFDLARTFGTNQRLNTVRFPLSRALQGAANDVLGGEQFPAPDRDLTRNVVRDLPNVVGKSVDEATRILDEAGFTAQVGEAVDSEIGQGLVAEQSPSAGRVPGGTTVILRPSTGKKPTAQQPAAGTVPNVTGAKYNQARAALEGLGFGVSEDGCNNGSTVTGQDPAANTAAPPGTEVTLRCGDDG